MPVQRAGWIVHGPIFLFALLGCLIAARGLALLIPMDLYFTFQSLFSERSTRSIVLSALLKMIAPLLTGFVFGWAACGAVRPLFRLGPLSPRRLRRVWSPTLFLAGFGAAFTSAWPLIVYWDLFANPAVAHLKPVFFGLYLLYMLGFGYVTLFGFLGAIYLRGHLGSSREKLVSINELTRVGALWVLNSGFASFVMQAITK